MVEIEVKPVAFDLKGSFELIDLEYGKLRLWIPREENDLNKEEFKVTKLEFTNPALTPLVVPSDTKRPGMEWEINISSKELAGVNYKRS